MSYLYEEETYKILGACFEVHKTLGHGFLEAVYQEALEMEFQLRNIPYQREKMLYINYKGRQLKKHYVADFVCYDKIIIETKAISDLTSKDESQILNYLKVTNFKLGLLINFGKPSLQKKRIINEHYF